MLRAERGNQEYSTARKHAGSRHANREKGGKRDNESETSSILCFMPLIYACILTIKEQKLMGSFQDLKVP